MRVGIGYDVHKFEENRRLILGGVDIPYHKGLAGHSDADVLIHAIMDAIIGALNKGDIGKLFPDNDDTYKNINSMLLLKKVKELVEQENYVIENIDSIIVAEKPKMSPHIEQMKKNIADVLKMDVKDVSVKATTTERLGFEGRKEGISSQAIVLLKR